MNTRHIIYLALFIMAVLIQQPLWFEKGGILHMKELESEIAQIRVQNDKLRLENGTIAGEIESLESGSGAVEEHARMQLGMVRDDEVLFRFVPKGSVEPEKLSQYQKPVAPAKFSSAFRPKNNRLYSHDIPAANDSRKSK